MYRTLTLLTVLLLAALSCASPHPKPAATPVDTIQATVRLRPGVRPPPPDAILHITVRSAAGYIYAHHGAPVREWPVRVSIPIPQWPTSHKGVTMTLHVNARAESGGRDILVTESDVSINLKDIWAAKPIELTLHPAIE